MERLCICGVPRAGKTTFAPDAKHADDLISLSPALWRVTAIALFCFTTVGCFQSSAQTTDGGPEAGALEVRFLYTLYLSYRRNAARPEDPIILVNNAGVNAVETDAGPAIQFELMMPEGRLYPTEPISIEVTEPQTGSILATERLNAGIACDHREGVENPGAGVASIEFLDYLEHDPEREDPWFFTPSCGYCYFRDPSRNTAWCY